MIDWSFDSWPAIPEEWTHNTPKRQSDDHTEFHVDLGCGRIKKGRIGVDRFIAPGVNVSMDLNTGEVFSVAQEPGRDALYFEVPDYRWGRLLQWNQPPPVFLGLPFEDSSIHSMITHHCFEHIGDGFIPMMDDIYRVLVPNGLLRIIVPLFPSHDAVGDQDHKRYFMDDSFDQFCGTPGDTPQNCWLASFSVPYTRARFQKGESYATPAIPNQDIWEQHRELRISLRAVK